MISGCLWCLLVPISPAASCFVNIKDIFMKCFNLHWSISPFPRSISLLQKPFTHNHLSILVHVAHCNIISLDIPKMTTDSIFCWASLTYSHTQTQEREILFVIETEQMTCARGRSLSARLFASLGCHSGIPRSCPITVSTRYWIPEWLLLLWIMDKWDKWEITAEIQDWQSVLL